MIEPLIDMLAVSDDTETHANDKLTHVNNHAMAAMTLTLTWHSERVHHTDSLVIPKVNMWRDIFPQDLEAQLLGRTVGNEVTATFQPGVLTTAAKPDMCLAIPKLAFNRHLQSRTAINPNAGRFYPKGFIAGVKGIFSQDITPFRVTAVDAEHLMIDLNHPLAGHNLQVQVNVLDIWAARSERGGSCHDIAEMLTNNGPGMQARWHDKPTDFWDASSLCEYANAAFSRLDPNPDSLFYNHPRMVHHLDATAREQITRLYQRLLPQSGKVLDLMSSWSSHLAETIAPSQVVGLGLNQAELDANAILTERVVQDLNHNPHLPFATAQFDAVICTASIEYLTHPLAVFQEVQRVLKPGGNFVVTFSNRWFPSKVIRIWPEVHEFERMGIVLEYFYETGSFNNLETWSLRGLPRPAGDPHSARSPHSDPVYAVWGQRA